MEIHFIYADSCSKCREMEIIISECINGKNINLVKMECETEAAVEYAVENDICDLPACKIGNVIIQGENFTKRQIVDAIEQNLKNAT